MPFSVRKVIVIGAGGHAAEIDDYINNSEKFSGKKAFEIIGFLDDAEDSYHRYQFTAPYLGSINNHRARHNVYYMIGIANIAYRKPIVERFTEMGADFATFIHWGAYLSASAVIGKGVVVAPNVNIGPNVKIGNFTLLNSRCSVGHDTTVGEFNFICPNVCFSGHTMIGDNNLFGIGSATIPGITVGSRNKIAAGMVLDKNIGDDTVVFHRFKEKVIAVPRI